MVRCWLDSLWRSSGRSPKRRSNDSVEAERKDRVMRRHGSLWDVLTIFTPVAVRKKDIHSPLPYRMIGSIPVR